MMRTAKTSEETRRQRPHPAAARHALANRTPSPVVRTVLVIEDDAAFRQAVVAALSHEGCTVHEADGVEQAVAALTNTKFDAVFSDYKMPGNGHTVVHYMDSLHVTAPLVIISGEAPVDGLQLSGPVVAWMLKPVSLAQLRHMLRILPAGRRPQTLRKGS